MYSLSTAITYVQITLMVLSSMLVGIIGFVYVRLKLNKFFDYWDRRMTYRVIKYGEINTLLIVAVVTCWLILLGLEVK